MTNYHTRSENMSVKLWHLSILCRTETVFGVRYVVWTFCSLEYFTMYSIVKVCAMWSFLTSCLSETTSKHCRGYVLCNQLPNSNFSFFSLVSFLKKKEKKTYKIGSRCVCVSVCVCVCVCVSVCVCVCVLSFMFVLSRRCHRHWAYHSSGEALHVLVW